MLREGQSLFLCLLALLIPSYNRYLTTTRSNAVMVSRKNDSRPLNISPGVSPANLTPHYSLYLTVQFRRMSPPSDKIGHNEQSLLVQARSPSPRKLFTT